MILNFIKSTVESIKERTKNPFSENNTAPFAGAFIISLILYNWQLFFSIFSFDKTDIRLDKIEIINSYLLQEAWYYRTGKPIIFAFCSIAFFYLFNIISLGVTIIFNRWFKATILHFTDRSKIVTREELEKSINKMNKLRKTYDELNKTYAETQGEAEEYKGKLELTNSQLIALTLEKEKLTDDRKIIENQIKKNMELLHKRGEELADFQNRNGILESQIENLNKEVQKLMRNRELDELDEKIKRDIISAYDSVNLIKTLNKKEDLTDEDKKTVKRNVEHLKIMMAKEEFLSRLTIGQKAEISLLIVKNTQ